MPKAVKNLGKPRKTSQKRPERGDRAKKGPQKFMKTPQSIHFLATLGNARVLKGEKPYKGTPAKVCLF